MKSCLRTEGEVVISRKDKLKIIHTFTRLFLLRIEYLYPPTEAFHIVGIQ